MRRKHHQFLFFIVFFAVATLWSIQPSQAKWNLFSRQSKSSSSSFGKKNGRSKVQPKLHSSSTTRPFPAPEKRSTTDPGKLAQLLSVNSTSFPWPRQGCVRVYRGTSTPTRTQISLRLRQVLKAGKSCTLPRGDQHYLNFIEARRHAGGVGHPDAVSATTSDKVAMCKISGFGKYVIAYDIPVKVFEMLPPGDPCLAEVVFKHSIPDSFAVGTVRR